MAYVYRNNEGKIIASSTAENFGEGWLFIEDDAKEYIEYLEQILIILFDNAVKYSNGLSEINITLEQIGNRAVIKVKDHGVGIDPSELDKVFNRFYRVDKARTREVGGNGLGLAIAKQLVVSYKGTISADSVVGEGTTVSVSLPIMEEEVIQTARKKPLKKNKL